MTLTGGPHHQNVELPDVSPVDGLRGRPTEGVVSPVDRGAADPPPVEAFRRRARSGFRIRLGPGPMVCESLYQPGSGLNGRLGAEGLQMRYPHRANRGLSVPVGGGGSEGGDTRGLDTDAVERLAGGEK